ncbi:MAG: hypothetical protein CMF81_06805 [Candidatus Marinimicrobia bacterium]|nr:hypothetical protein [Candidatus Neomarinimicrobiota bacterium]
MSYIFTSRQIFKHDGRCRLPFKTINLDNYIYLLCALLALVGGAFSFYFYGVYRGWIRRQQIWIPRFFELESSHCLSIVETKYGQIFGLPNALSGIFILLGYAIILICTSLGYIGPIISLYIGGFIVAISIYLIIGLIHLKVTCRICLFVHFLNASILLIQII